MKKIREVKFNVSELSEIVSDLYDIQGTLMGYEENTYKDWADASRLLSNITTKLTGKIPEAFEEEITHRVNALVYLFKVEAKVIQPIPMNSHKPAKYKQAIYSLNEKSTNYKPPQKHEITKAIELLREFPKAELLAKEKLSRIRKEI